VTPQPLLPALRRLSLRSLPVLGLPVDMNFVVLIATQQKYLCWYFTCIILRKVVTGA